MSAPKCAACGGDWPMGNPYSLSKGQRAVRELACATGERTGSVNGGLRIRARGAKDGEGGLTV
jgi:hypothetical protein